MLGSLLKRVLGIGSATGKLREGIAAYEFGSFKEAARLLSGALGKEPDNT